MGNVNNAKTLFQRTGVVPVSDFVSSLATYVSILDAGKHNCRIRRAAETETPCVILEETRLSAANPYRGPLVEETHNDLLRAYALAFYRFFAPEHPMFLSMLRLMPTVILCNMLETSVEELEKRLSLQN